jgi:hypothetical protein
VLPVRAPRNTSPVYLIRGGPDDDTLNKVCDTVAQELAVVVQHFADTVCKETVERVVNYLHAGFECNKIVELLGGNARSTNILSHVFLRTCQEAERVL